MLQVAAPIAKVLDSTWKRSSLRQVPSPGVLSHMHSLVETKVRVMQGLDLRWDTTA